MPSGISLFLFASLIGMRNEPKWAKLNSVYKKTVWSQQTKESTLFAKTSNSIGTVFLSHIKFRYNTLLTTESIEGPSSEFSASTDLRRFLIRNSPWRPAQGSQASFRGGGSGGGEFIRTTKPSVKSQCLSSSIRKNSTSDLNITKP